MVAIGTACHGPVILDLILDAEPAFEKHQIACNIRVQRTFRARTSRGQGQIDSTQQSERVSTVAAASQSWKFKTSIEARYDFDVWQVQWWRSYLFHNAWHMSHCPCSSRAMIHSFNLEHKRTSKGCLCTNAFKTSVSCISSARLLSVGCCNHLHPSVRLRVHGRCCRRCFAHFETCAA